MSTADIDDTIARNGTDPKATPSADADTSDAPDAGVAPGVLLESSAPDVTTGFMSELTVAMMGVVGKERDRIDEIVAADAASHLAQAKERAAAEADAFRQIADEDVANIESWADAEVERIRADAATRIADRKADLDTNLLQHDAVLTGELQGIETAVSDYGLTLQRFLDDLRETGDPAEIAHRARSLPTPPALDDVRAVARAAALTKIAEAAAAEAPGADAASVTSDAEAAVDGGLDATTRSGDAVVSSTTDAPATAVDDTPATADTGTAPSPWTDRQDASPAGDAAIGSPVAVGGGSTSPTGWESDGGLESLMDTPSAIAGSESTMAASRPVAVMDPDATTVTGWETDLIPPAVTTAVATAERTDVGHPNAAVRLIRSVAPWTAPSHPDEGADTRPE